MGTCVNKQPWRREHREAVLFRRLLQVVRRDIQKRVGPGGEGFSEMLRANLLNKK